MNIGEAGLAIIKKWEGCRLVAYLDVVGVWTVGFGDTGPDVVKGLRITQDEADRRLADRLAREFEPGVEKALGQAPVRQNQFDAMVSLAYNVGVGTFSRSSIVRHHIAGDYDAAADAFLLYRMAGGKVYDGLVRRRIEERGLYLSEVSTPPLPHPPIVDIVDPIADAVRALQRALNAEGARLLVDGDLGNRTIAAYRAAVA